MSFKNLKAKAPIILAIFICLQPLIDVLTTLGDVQNWGLSIGLATRGLFMAIIFIYLLTQQKWRVPALAIAGFLLLAVIVQLTSCEPNTVYLATLFKIFYLPLVAMFFYHFKSQLFSRKIYFVLLATYLILLVVPSLLQISLVEAVNYDGKIWQRGLFAAGNDLSAILIALSPLALSDLIKNRQWILLVSTSLLLVIAGVLIGTKVMLLGLPAVAIFLLVKFGKTWARSVKWAVGAGLVLAAGAAVLVLPLTPVFKNTLIALNYHGVNSAADIVKPEIIDKVILSERPSFFLKTSAVYAQADWSQKLLGLQPTDTDVTIESDPFDIFFASGILGTAVYLFGIWYLLRAVDWRLISSQQKFSSLTLLILAALVGHVLITPAVATILGLNFLRLKKLS